MEHAARYHIRKHLDEDPVHYQKLSERLEEILQQFGENWEQLVLALRSFLEKEVIPGRQQDETGLDPATQAPFFAVLRQERESEAPVSASDVQWLKELTIKLVDHIRKEVSIVDFWKNANAQEVLRGQIFDFLDCNEVVSFERADAVADRLMELAKANHARLVEA